TGINMPKFKCKLTLQEGKPVDAHIIPAAFYDRRDSANPPLVMSTVEHFPRRLRNGVYDANLVTQAGEEYFKRPDDYAYKLLVEGRNKFLKMRVGRHNLGLALHEYDYKSLRMFFLTLLWRTAQTDRMEFSRV